MVDEETNDMFKDFKFEDNKEPSHDEIKKNVQKEFDQQRSEEHEEKDNEEEVRGLEEVRELKEEVRELKEHVKRSEEREEKEKPEVKHVIKHIKSEPEIKYVTKPGPGALERGVLIGLIAILSFFIIFDLAFIHPGGVVETEEGAVGMVVSEVVSENKTEEVEETVEEENKTTETVEEKELSGTIDLEINKIHSLKENENRGYINRVTFTIKNGKNETLKPIVRVYAYDQSSKDTYMDWVRGTFNYTISIMPGDERAGSIDLTPKTFTALNTIKTVVLKLSDEEDELTRVVEEKFYIE